MPLHRQKHINLTRDEVQDPNFGVSVPLHQQKYINLTRDEVQSTTQREIHKTVRTRWKFNEIVCEEAFSTFAWIWVTAEMPCTFDDEIKTTKTETENGHFPKDTAQI